MKNVLISDSGKENTLEILKSILSNSDGELNKLNIVILRRHPDLKDFASFKSKKINFEGENYIAYYNHKLIVDQNIERIELDPLVQNFDLENKSQIKIDSKDKKTLCSYSAFDYDQPILIDDYKFKWKSGFIDNLSNMYDHINNENVKLKIENIYTQSPKLFLRDILTAYTVKNIFTTTEKIPTGNKLIHIMNKIMKSLYEEFYKNSGIRLYFIYRGGNILKLYKTNFENVIPGKTKKFLKEEFDDFFKFSDIDFYTVIENSENMSPHEILNINIYIQMMCYYGCYLARIFIMNNTQLFKFCKFNELEIKEQYNELLESMNKDKDDSEFAEIRNAKFIGLGFDKFFYIKKKNLTIEQLLNSPSSKLDKEFIQDMDDVGVLENYRRFGKSGRFDFNINPVVAEESTEINKINYIQDNLTVENYNKFVKELLEINPIFDFYISNNNRILNEEEYINFSLVRLMINYTVAYERNGKYGLTHAPSELFDLSIGNPDDKMYRVYISKNITKFEFKYEEDKKDEIYIPKLETTLIDLISILFEYRDFPWEDVKYEKRIYRLLILIFIKELPKNSLKQIRKKLVSKEKRKYINIEDIDFDTIRYRNQELKDLSKYLKSEFKNYHEYEIKFDQVLNKLIHIVDKIQMFEDEEHKLVKRDIYNFDL